MAVMYFPARIWGTVFPYGLHLGVVRESGYSFQASGCSPVGLGKTTAKISSHCGIFSCSPEEPWEPLDRALAAWVGFRDLS